MTAADLSRGPIQYGDQAYAGYYSLDHMWSMVLQIVDEICNRRLCNTSLTEAGQAVIYSSDKLKLNSRKPQSVPFSPLRHRLGFI